MVRSARRSPSPAIATSTGNANEGRTDGQIIRSMSCFKAFGKALVSLP